MTLILMILVLTVSLIPFAFFLVAKEYLETKGIVGAIILIPTAILTALTFLFIIFAGFAAAFNTQREDNFFVTWAKYFVAIFQA